MLNTFNVKYAITAVYLFLISMIICVLHMSHKQNQIAIIFLCHFLCLFIYILFNGVICSLSHLVSDHPHHVKFLNASYDKLYTIFFVLRFILSIMNCLCK